MAMRKAVDAAAFVMGVCIIAALVVVVVLWATT
jgi:hypothetical protein